MLQEIIALRQRIGQCAANVRHLYDDPNPMDAISQELLQQNQNPVVEAARVLGLAQRLDQQLAERQDFFRGGDEWDQQAEQALLSQRQSLPPVVRPLSARLTVARLQAYQAGLTNDIPGLVQCVEQQPPVPTGPFAPALFPIDVDAFEEILLTCAARAERQVNQTELQRTPDRNDCNQNVHFRGEVITRAMAFGTLKGEAAENCVQQTMTRMGRANEVVMEATYYPHQDRVEYLGSNVQRYGSQRPDVVLYHLNRFHHDIDAIRRVYDYKFPCPPAFGAQSAWRQYRGNDQRFAGLNQGQIYRNLLRAEVFMVSPGTIYSGGA